MRKFVLLARLEAKPESFLRGTSPVVEEEPGAVGWFAIRLGPSSYGILDAFPGEAGREAHLSGRAGAAPIAKAAGVFSQPPLIEKREVLADTLPGRSRIEKEGGRLDSFLK